MWIFLSQHIVSVVWVAEMLPSMKTVSSELGNYNILGRVKLSYDFRAKINVAENSFFSPLRVEVKISSLAYVSNSALCGRNSTIRQGEIFQFVQE